MSALLPLNWQRVSSSEDNSGLLTYWHSAGEFSDSPALLTCHLCDGANVGPPWIKAEGRIKNYETSNARHRPPSLILFSLDLVRAIIAIAATVLLTSCSGARQVSESR